MKSLGINQIYEMELPDFAARNPIYAKPSYVRISEIVPLLEIYYPLSRTDASLLKDWNINRLQPIW